MKLSGLIFFVGSLALGLVESLAATPSNPDGSSAGIQEVLGAVQKLQSTQHKTSEEKASALRSLQQLDGWEGTLWSHLVDLTRKGEWTEEDERAQGMRKSEADAKARAAAAANGGTIRGDDPAVLEYKRVESAPGDSASARRKISEILNALSANPSDASVRLIAPLLDAKGKYFMRGDYGDPPIQERAYDALLAIAIIPFHFKGEAPGAAEVVRFLEAMERNHRGQQTPIPQIPGTVDDWRKWWSVNKISYGATFELPPELRVPPLVGAKPQANSVKTPPSVPASPNSPEPRSPSSEIAEAKPSQPIQQPEQPSQKWILWLAASLVIGITASAIGWKQKKRSASGPK